MVNLQAAVEREVFKFLKVEIQKGNLENLVQARIIHDDAKIMELITILKMSRINSFDSLLFLVCCLSNELFMELLCKFDFLDGLESCFPRLCNIKDDHLKIDYIDKVNVDLLYILIALSIEDINMRDKYMSRVGFSILNSYINSLKNEEMLLRVLPYIYEKSEDTYYELKAIYANIQFSNRENKYLHNSNDRVQYSKKENEVLYAISQIESRSTKLQLLKQNSFINDLGLNVIRDTKCEEERRFLINELYDLRGKEIYFKEFHKQFVIPDYKSSLPENLMFGVEIECFGDSARPILYYSNKILNYDVKPETALPDGLEFSSPKLSWKRQDLNTIYQICDFAKANSLRCIGRSGGHIHFSSDYLDSRDAWYWFFYLYSKFEKILYKISNPEGQVPRKNIFSIAKPFSRSYVENLHNFENINDRRILVHEVQNLFDTKFVGMNLSNIFYRFNTIEIRIPNGTLDADEIIKRILLYGNLIKLARKLSFLPLSLDIYEKLYELDRECEEEKILYIMLDLLFESEKEKAIFRDRYMANRNFNQDIEYDMKSFSFKKRGIII